MRKIFIILCCGLLFLTCGCGKNDEVTPTVTTIKTASEIKKTEEEKPPTNSQPTETLSASSTTTTAEKEKEVESEPTSTAESTPPTTTTSKTETTVTEKPNPTQNTSSVVELTETPPTEEIYNTQIEVNPADIEKLVVQYINEHRVAQGDTAATLLSGLTEVARYRAKQLVTNFSHNSIPDACTELKYGEYVDLTPYGMEESDNYYRGYNREAIGMGGWCGTAEVMAHRIADGFRNSTNHWRYVGSSEYCYIAVGVVHENNNWYVCVCMSHTNYGG